MKIVFQVELKWVFVLIIRNEKNIAIESVTWLVLIPRTIKHQHKMGSSVLLN